MKHPVLSSIAVACAATMLVVQTGSTQNTTEQTIKVMGCLQGDGSAESPWVLTRVVLPAPPAAAPAGAPGGGGAVGGRGGGAAGGGGGRGAAAGAPGGAAPGGAAQGGAPQ